MLLTLAIILIVLWLAGFVTPHKLGHFIHLLLVAALIIILILYIPAIPMLVR